MVKSLRAVLPPHVQLLVSGTYLNGHSETDSSAPWLATAPPELTHIQPPPHTHNTGGVQPEDMPAYLRAGAIGFALGSTLYKPGLEAEELRRRARLFVDAVARGRETDAWAAATLGL